MKPVRENQASESPTHESNPKKGQLLLPGDPLPEEILDESNSPYVKAFAPPKLAVYAIAAVVLISVVFTWLAFTQPLTPQAIGVFGFSAAVLSAVFFMATNYLGDDSRMVLVVWGRPISRTQLNVALSVSGAIAVLIFVLGSFLVFGAKVAESKQDENLLRALQTQRELPNQQLGPYSKPLEQAQNELSKMIGVIPNEEAQARMAELQVYRSALQRFGNQDYRGSARLLAETSFHYPSTSLLYGKTLLRLKKFTEAQKVFDRLQATDGIVAHEARVGLSQIGQLTQQRLGATFLDPTVVALSNETDELALAVLADALLVRSVEIATEGNPQRAMVDIARAADIYAEDLRYCEFREELLLESCITFHQIASMNLPLSGPEQTGGFSKMEELLTEYFDTVRRTNRLQDLGVLFDTALAHVFFSVGEQRLMEQRELLQGLLDFATRLEAKQVVSQRMLDKLVAFQSMIKISDSGDNAVAGKYQAGATAARKAVEGFRKGLESPLAADEYSLWSGVTACSEASLVLSLLLTDCPLEEVESEVETCILHLSQVKHHTKKLLSGLDAAISSLASITRNDKSPEDVAPEFRRYGEPEVKTLLKKLGSKLVSERSRIAETPLVASPE